MATAGVPTFGLALKNFVGPSERPDIDALYAYAERAEALGFESVASGPLVRSSFHADELAGTVRPGEKSRAG